MKLRIKVATDLSDSLLFKLAFMGCIPAVELYMNRKKNKASLNESSLRLRKALIKRGVKLRLTGSPGDNESLRKIEELTNWHPFLGELPISCLVNPLNNKETNLKLVRENKLIKEIYYGINFKKIKLSGSLLSPRDINTIIASVIWFNWFLRQHTSKRPSAPNLDFFLREESLEAFSLTNSISDFDKDLEEELTLLAQVLSSELIALVGSFSETVLRGLQNKYHFHVETSKMGPEKGILPSYAILKEDSLDSLPIIESLHHAGYKNLNHLIFLDRRVTGYLLNDNFIQEVKNF